MHEKQHNTHPVDNFQTATRGSDQDIAMVHCNLMVELKETTDKNARISEVQWEFAKCTREISENKTSSLYLV